MIECCEENVYYKRKKSNFKKNRLVSVLIVLILVALIVAYYCNVSYPFIVQICKDKIQKINTSCVNNSILTTLSKVKYDDIINIDKNSSDEIELISTNSVKINDISRNVVKDTELYLDIELSKGIKIPWLAFLGSNILSGYGSEVDFKSINVSSVSCDFVSTFKSVGINQTLHSIYIDVISEIVLEFPLDKNVSEFSTKILVTEAILVGKVPEVYLNGNLFS